MGKKALNFLFWFLASFLAYRILWGSFPLTSLSPNYDEGVYFYQALRILEGEKPYRDFFTHQFPFYPILLSYWFRFFPADLYHLRLFSLLSWIVLSSVVARFLSSRLSSGWGILSLILFFSTPLTHKGFWGLPNTISLLFLVAGFLLSFGKSPLLSTLLSSFFLSFSFLLKPLSLPGIVVYLFYPFSYPYMPHLLRKGFYLSFFTLLFLSLFHFLEEPLFYDSLVAQFGRYQEHTGFSFFHFCPLFSLEAKVRLADHYLLWNITEFSNLFFHREVLPYYLPFFLSIPFLWLKGGVEEEKKFFLAVFLSTKLFFLLIFEPVWDHYFLYLFPPLLIVTVLSYHTVLLKIFPFAKKPFFSLLSALLIGFGLLKNFSSYTPPQFFLRNPPSEEEILSFNPTLPLFLKKKPACQFTDPLNSFTRRTSFWVLLSSPYKERVGVTPEKLFLCVKENPKIVVFFDPFTGCFLTKEEMKHWEKEFSSRLFWVSPPFYPER